MGMFTERGEDWMPEGACEEPQKVFGDLPEKAIPLHSGGIVRGIQKNVKHHNEGEDFLGEPSSYVLQGFHNRSGHWVTLAAVDTKEDAENALKKCHSKTQPSPKEVSIAWDHFAAFRCEPRYTITWTFPHGYR